MKTRASSLHALLVALGALCLSTSVQADMLSQTVALPQISDSFSFSEGDADSHFTIVPIDGLGQFDPSLGTLTGVSMAINADDFSSSLEITAVENGNGPFEADFSADFFDLEVVYNTLDNGSSVGKVVASYDLPSNISCGGEMGDGSCFDNIEDTGPWQEGNDFTGQANLGDFVGPGPLNVFEIYWVAYQYLVSGQNIDDGFGDAFIELTEGDIGFDTNTFTLTYEFTPVPLPASCLLAAPAVAFLTRRRKT